MTFDTFLAMPLTYYHNSLLFSHLFVTSMVICCLFDVFHHLTVYKASIFSMSYGFVASTQLRSCVYLA